MKVGLSPTDGEKGKLKEYQSLSLAYDNLIEEVWNLRPREITTVTRYMDCDLDKLPEDVS
jgi:hypothetical protein